MLVVPALGSPLCGCSVVKLPPSVSPTLHRGIIHSTTPFRLDIGARHRLYFKLMAPSSCPLLATLNNTRTSKENNYESLAAICSKGAINSDNCLGVAFPLLLFPPREAAARDVALRGQTSVRLAAGWLNNSFNRQILLCWHYTSRHFSTESSPSRSELNKPFIFSNASEQNLQIRQVNCSWGHSVPCPIYLCSVYCLLKSAQTHLSQIAVCYRSCGFFFTAFQGS